MPGQPFAIGFMVIVAIMESFVLLVVIKEGMSPVPLAPKPIFVLLFNHVKVVPDTGPEITVSGDVSPLQ